MQTRILDLPDHATAIAELGDGPPLLLLHAVGLDHRVWGEVMPRLADRFRVIPYDLRGFGAADGAPVAVSMSHFARDGLQLMDALGLDRAHFCGLSLGAAVAAHMALAAPKRCANLTLACGLPLGVPVFAERAARAEAGGMGAVISDTVGRWFSEQDRSEAPEALAYAQSRLAACAVPHWAATWRAMATDGVLPDLAMLPVPRRMIAGEADASLPLGMARAGASVIGAPLYVVPGAGHLPPLTAPQTFAEALLAAAA